VTTDTRVQTRVAPRRLRAKRGRWWIEVFIAVVGYELYSAVQSLTTGHVGAYAHANDVVRAEHGMHIGIEATFNHFATVHAWIGVSAGYYYELTHVCGTAAVLVYLWCRARSRYTALRNVLITMSIPALFVYGVWPVAPPRLAVGGISDTLVAHNILGAAHVHGGFVNLYAAMPSLHVAWATWCAGAIVVTSSSRWKHAAWIYPAMTTYAVLATGNHFVLDCIAGAALALVAFLLWRRSLASGGRVWWTTSKIS
jgi:hypothetical protein